MNAIQSLSISSLRVEEDFGYQRCILNQCQYLPKESGSEPDIGSSPALTAAIEHFTQCLNKFDEALKTPNTIVASDRVIICDFARDKSWKGSYSYVKAMCKHPDLEVRAIAQEVLDLYEKYGNPMDLPQIQESRIIHNLLQDLNNISLESMEKLYFSKWKEDLENKEQDFLTALDERTQLQSKRQTGIIKETRTASDNAYRELIYTVNASILINGKEPYSVFVNNTNVFIKNMKTTLKARATINAKKEKRGKSKGNTPVTKK